MSFCSGLLVRYWRPLGSGLEGLLVVATSQPHLQEVPNVISDGHSCKDLLQLPALEAILAGGRLGLQTRTVAVCAET